MADVLLQTKLYRPTRSLAQRPFLVPRTHLSHKLQSGLPGKLTLVSAPAGFGKTTMVVTWLNELADAQTRIGWLSLDERDNDPVRFLAYLVAALQTADSQLGQTAVHLLQSPQPAAPEAVLSLLINDLSQSQQRTLLVLDDYHVIADRSIHQAITFLLDNLPPALHLILISRSDPPLPLSRLRARGNMNEVRAADLRFSSDETAAFLNHSRQLNLTEADIAALEQRTEGWIAGLQLAALSLQGHDNVPGFIASFSGNSRYIMDYLVDEVLQKRPSGSEQFLLKTAVLDRFCAPLCDHLTDRSDSQEILDQLEHANLFLVPLDDQRNWYRYHHLFADVLHNRLQRSQPLLLTQLYQRASQWCEQQNLLMEAVDYAFRAADFDRFAYLIERYAPGLSFSGQMHTVSIWLNALPEASKRARPSLYIYHAAVLAFTNHLAAAEECLQKADQVLVQQSFHDLQPILLGQVDVIRGHLCRITGNMVGCLKHAHRAVASLPEVEHTPLKLRGVAMLDTARAFRWQGDVQPDKEEFALSVRQPIREAGNSFALLNSVTNLAYLQTLQGRLRQARATYQEALELVAHPDQLKYLFGGASYFFGLGDLLREQNELDEAAHYLAQGEKLVQGMISADADIVTLGYIALARLQQNQGNTEAANTTLNTLIAIGQQRHFVPHLLTRAAAAQVQVWLAQNNLPAAANWADNSQLRLTDEVAFPYEPHYLTLVRVRLAQNQLEGIRPLLHRLQTAAAAQNRHQSLIEIHILQALTHQAANDLPAALHALQQAIILAAPEGYIRIFADEGEPMGRLLAQLPDGRNPFIQYIHNLRQILHQSPPPPPLPTGIDSLSEREMEVLRLIAEGASNQEIAAALVVTVSTVKKHVSNILSKLNSTSRTQAAAEARALNLL